MVTCIESTDMLSRALNDKSSSHGYAHTFNLTMLAILLCNPGGTHSRAEYVFRSRIPIKPPHSIANAEVDVCSLGRLSGVFLSFFGTLDGQAFRQVQSRFSHPSERSRIQLPGTLLAQHRILAGGLRFLRLVLS